jgi:hypothetical protein
MLEVHTIQGRNKDHYEFSCESLDSLDINKLIPNVEYYIIKPGYYLLGMCMLKNNKFLFFTSDKVDLLKVWRAFPLIRT